MDLGLRDLIIAHASPAPSPATIKPMREALRNIWRRKVRSALTIFGVAIGIFALTTMGSLSENINKSIQTMLDYYSSRITVTAESAGSAGNGGLFSQGGQLPVTLVDRIRVIDGVATAYPTITLPVDESQIATFSSPQLIYAFQPSDTKNDPKKLGLQSGRELADGDTGKVVIGSSIVTDQKVKTGDTITLKGRAFQIVGILERTGGGPDGFYFITLTDAQTLLRASNVFTTETANFVTDIQVIPASNVNADALADTIKQKVRGVNAIPPGTLKKQVEQASAVFNLIILGSALIAVIVGGLSVINTMVMSISERRKEIGIKRVVGAKTRHILYEFVTETALMGLIGGLIGLGLGALLTTIINMKTKATGVEIFTLTPRLALGALGFALVLGVIAGIYPAFRAARIKPVNVLREE